MKKESIETLLDVFGREAKDTRIVHDSVLGAYPEHRPQVASNLAEKAGMGDDINMMAPEASSIRWDDALYFTLTREEGEKTLSAIRDWATAIEGKGIVPGSVQVVDLNKSGKDVGMEIAISHATLTRMIETIEEQAAKHQISSGIKAELKEKTGDKKKPAVKAKYPDLVIWG